MSVDFPWTPHEAVWEPKANSRRGGPANDGNAPSSVAPKTLAVHFADAMRAPRVLERYGVVVQDQGWLVIGIADDFDLIADGDVLVWNGRRFQVTGRPQVWRPGDGIDHGELIAEDLSTGINR